VANGDIPDLLQMGTGLGWEDRNQVKVGGGASLVDFSAPAFIQQSYVTH
jgi:hypothetical protein